MSTKVCSLTALSLLLCTAQFRAQPTSAPNRVENIRNLSQQLRWHDEASHRDYERTKGALTHRFLEEVDGFVTESFRPDTASPGLVKAGLDALLGHKNGDLTQDVAFSADLAVGRFLIVGVELRRGGGAISENAISFRAYKATGNRFVLSANTNDLRSGDPENPFLCCVNAIALPASPAPEEFWFIVWADIPPRAPPTIAIRLYAFDGAAFRAVWAPDDIVAQHPETAVELNTGGFVVSRLPDPKGCVVIHEQYVLTAEGPRKSSQWESQCQ